MDSCAVAWLPRHEASKRILGICCATIFMYGPCIPPPRPSYVMSIFNWLGCHCVALASCFCHRRHCLPRPLSIVRTIVVKAKIVGLELHPLPLPGAVLGSPRVRQRRRVAPLDVRVFVYIIVLAYVPQPSHRPCLLLPSSSSSCR